MQSLGLKDLSTTSQSFTIFFNQKSLLSPSSPYSKITATI
ncbi:hypothetical protein DDB_G0271212 [Dictyostelium discoideum AX4]|uniref:Uncharacterized protein n=1 Tax=Dictyostelium discoideum TaxID=44689 RepID=Q55B82_DICDI|nr:hypothetical protein DDB_G0271212 [Dictyostelium discoideum AX4]EAL71736.1 hypothetical protein DDB_G0271212 [Dictyostelium discoideum AX4]|eukprot:XP_645730.1 hypothetical protein DDB_G0271212 [Dictyostelium discoideum AX4]